MYFLFRAMKQMPTLEVVRNNSDFKVCFAVLLVSMIGPYIVAGMWAIQGGLMRSRRAVMGWLLLFESFVVIYFWIVFDRRMGWLTYVGFLCLVEIVCFVSVWIDKGRDPLGIR